MDTSKMSLLCDILADVTGLQRDLITAEIQEGARRRVARRATRSDSRPLGGRSRRRASVPPAWNRASLLKGSRGRVQEDGLGVGSGEGSLDVEASWGVVRGSRRAGNLLPLRGTRALLWLSKCACGPWPFSLSVCARCAPTERMRWMRNT